jgi:SPP1 family predicted phage head-tail adaptor
MQAGKLDRLVQLQHRVLTRNGVGEQVASYVTYATVWAGKRDLRGREYFAAQQINPELQATWTIRWRSDVVATDRLIDDNGTAFDLASPPAEIGRHHGLDLLCKSASP